jgi:tight adherence protein B
MAEKNKKNEPQYLQSKINNPVLNYRVYNMSKSEKLLYFVIAALVGGVVSYVFYGGMFKDQEGASTTATYISNAFFFIVFALIAVRIYLPIREAQLKDKRQSVLRYQFRELLEALSSSFSSGMNVLESFASAYDDLKKQFTEDALIVRELFEILEGMRNNIPIEKLLADLGERSGDEEIASFAEVFEVCFREGGDIRVVVRRTHSIMMDKMSTEDEIKTKLTSNTMQLNVMTVVPIFIVAFLKFTNESFAENFTSPVGIVAITVSIGIFIAAYYWGRKIVNIRG